MKMIILLLKARMYTYCKFDFTVATLSIHCRECQAPNIFKAIATEYIRAGHVAKYACHTQRKKSEFYITNSSRDGKLSERVKKSRKKKMEPSCMRIEPRTFGILVRCSYQYFEGPRTKVV